MISRAHRFHGFNSLRNVYRQGAMARGPLFAVKAIADPRRKSYRLAVVVSRKVSKSAVVRNRMRRRLYALVGEQQSQITQPFDIVITVFHDSLATTPAAELKDQLKKQFKQLGILK
ncbi:MAG: ribonuclease P protein component [Candidatus Saccharimonadales bacterium]